MCLRPQSHGIRGVGVMLLLFSVCGLRTGLLVFFYSAAATETGHVGLGSGTPATLITSSRGKHTWLGRAERSEIQKIHVDDVLRPHPHVRGHFPKLLLSSLPPTSERWKKHLRPHVTTTKCSNKYIRPPWGVKPDTKEEHSELWCQKTDRQPGWLANRLHDNNAVFATSLCFMPTLASQF